MVRPSFSHALRHIQGKYAWCMHHVLDYEEKMHAMQSFVVTVLALCFHRVMVYERTLLRWWPILNLDFSDSQVGVLWKEVT